MYVCMYVCMYGWMDGWEFLLFQIKKGNIGLCIGLLMFVYMFVCTVGMYCMYVFPKSIYSHTILYYN